MVEVLLVHKLCVVCDVIALIVIADVLTVSVFVFEHLPHVSLLMFLDDRSCNVLQLLFLYLYKINSRRRIRGTVEG